MEEKQEPVKEKKMSDSSNSSSSSSSSPVEGACVSPSTNNGDIVFFIGQEAGQTPWTIGLVECPILNSSSSESSIDSGLDSPGAPSSRNSPLSLNDAIVSTSNLTSMLVNLIMIIIIIINESSLFLLE